MAASFSETLGRVGLLSNPWRPLCQVQGAAKGSPLFAPAGMLAKEMENVLVIWLYSFMKLGMGDDVDQREKHSRI